LKAITLGEALACVLLLSGVAFAQTAEDQATWGKLWHLICCEDAEQALHEQGFSEKGARDLIAYVKRSDEELGALALERSAKICAKKDTLDTPQKVAAEFKAMSDALNGLRRQQIETFANVLSADDMVAWATFRDQESGSAQYTDVAAMILSGQVPTEHVLERACAAGANRAPQQ
jgi:hypothetical protein